MQRLPSAWNPKLGGTKADSGKDKLRNLNPYLTNILKSDFSQKIMTGKFLFDESDQ